MANDIDTSVLGNLGLAQRQLGQPGDRLGQKEFLDLMITQLRNQDPFKPMESGEFLGQLAQFGTVSGISDMQQSLDGLAGAVRGSQTLQAASLVDREVMVAAHEAWLPPDGTLKAGIELPDGVTDVTVAIYDLHGQLIDERPARIEDGTARLQWDGALPDGRSAAPGFYELRATGKAGGEPVALEVLVSGRVESVTTKGAGGGLSLTVTGLGVVDLERVRGIG